MKLTKISQITGVIELQSGLHIGSGNTEMHIGGTDNPVIKNPISNEPYIPGSSIKGKMRSTLEWYAGVVGVTNGRPLGFDHIGELKDDERKRGIRILSLFGYSPIGSNMDEELIKEIGPTRLAFWDCNLDPAWVDEMKQKNLLLTETKMENSIDRIKGTAENPRNTERVPAGARFTFRLTLKVVNDEDLLDPVLQGLRLLEMTGLGGSLSRGYGKIAFRSPKLDGEDISSKLAEVEL